MKITVLVVVALLMASTAEARPKHRVATWQFWVANGVNVGVSVATSLTINRCMHDHGIGPCWGGDYGPFNAKESIRGGFSSAAIPISYFWKKQDEEEQRKHKLWWLIPAIPAAINSGTIIHNASHQFGPREVEASAAAKNYQLR